MATVARVMQDILEKNAKQILMNANPILAKMVELAKIK